MSEKKIILEEIWNKYKEFTKGPNLPGMIDLDYFKPIVNLMICEGISKSLELASENAKIKSVYRQSCTKASETEYVGSSVDKQSITNTIKQII